MVAFGPQTFTLLENEAKERGVSVQELLRAVIIPEWFRTQGDNGKTPPFRSKPHLNDSPEPSIASSNRLQTPRL